MVQAAANDLGIYQAKFHHTPKYVMLSSAANTYTMAAVDEKNIHFEKISRIKFYDKNNRRTDCRN